MVGELLAKQILEAEGKDRYIEALRLRIKGEREENIRLKKLIKNIIFELQKAIIEESPTFGESVRMGQIENFDPKKTIKGLTNEL